MDPGGELPKIGTESWCSEEIGAHKTECIRPSYVGERNNCSKRAEEFNVELRKVKLLID